ncbi:MAG: ferrous iron transport protein A [Firmicutes bacterium]|nr:ferrous iron transport protein A [Bacillota bacterium]
MTLADVKIGDKFTILSIENKDISAQAYRLGISEGANIYCLEKIPKGPVIVKRSLQEIAIGRNLAKKIIIKMNKEV